MNKPEINETDPYQVETGDVMLFQFYVKVNSVETRKVNNEEETVLKVTNLDNGDKLTMSGNTVIKKALSANYYEESCLGISRTDMIKIIKKSVGHPMQVQFTKKDGSPRNMICKFLYTTDTGYAFVDEFTDKEIQHRQVDLRTIEWVIINGIYYKIRN